MVETIEPGHLKAALKWLCDTVSGLKDANDKLAEDNRKLQGMDLLQPLCTYLGHYPPRIHPRAYLYLPLVLIFLSYLYSVPSAELPPLPALPILLLHPTLEISVFLSLLSL